MYRGALATFATEGTIPATPSLCCTLILIPKTSHRVLKVLPGHQTPPTHPQIQLQNPSLQGHHALAGHLQREQGELLEHFEERAGAEHHDRGGRRGGELEREARDSGFDTAQEVSFLTARLGFRGWF